METVNVLQKNQSFPIFPLPKTASPILPPHGDSIYSPTKLSEHLLPGSQQVEMTEVPIWTLGGSDGKESACNAGDPGSIPRLGRSPGEGNGYPFHVLLPGESYRQRSLVGYSPWGRRVRRDWATHTLITIHCVGSTHGTPPPPQHICILFPLLTFPFIQMFKSTWHLKKPLSFAQCPETRPFLHNPLSRKNSL